MKLIKELGRRKAGLKFKGCGCQQTPSGERNLNYRHGASDLPVA